jgi:hypothetical protein
MLVGTAHRLDEGDGAGPDVDESRAFEQAARFLLVRELSRGPTGWPMGGSTRPPQSRP